MCVLDAAAQTSVMSKESLISVIRHLGNFFLSFIEGNVYRIFPHNIFDAYLNDLVGSGLGNG